MMSLLLCAMLFAGIIGMPMTVSAKEVKISETDYKVTYNGASDMFLCNKKSIGGGVGTEVWLTYTVAKVKESLATVHGGSNRSTGNCLSVFYRNNEFYK